MANLNIKEIVEWMIEEAKDMSAVMPASLY